MTDKPNKNIPNNDNEIAPEGMNGSSLDLSRIAKEAVERKKLELLDDGDDEFHAALSKLFAARCSSSSIASRTASGVAGACNLGLY